MRGLEGGLRQHRARPEDAADAAAQPLPRRRCAPRKSEAEYRAALEATIEESDGLIRTFNALLMIARAESGQARDNMTEFDAAEIARGVGELYEPLAEEKGLSLRIEAARRRDAHAATANWSARRSPIWSTTRSSMRASTARSPTARRQIVLSARRRRRPRAARASPITGRASPEADRGARGRALRAAGAEPLRAGLGPRA